ncbi:transforming growth factor-beta-induced protein ig-h3-like [Mizuhopecten yessoensis]|uniref:Transforming growth factor-beta-induced protein ig-h3 n=1 Tax=Mizuhopecten yessoensis TaxID=6573 RepID=A0A210QAI1_MIZYE|nr:transforming growth factor-beta-induced protein ig-h3-like [Mizuhopecten yessoensis]OWF45719.1 Transforming growth factor-beta-induced protein ig-h3 [Mizuhopecten yessoensis]
MLVLLALVLPCVLAQSNDTIIDALKASSREQTLVALIQQAGLTDVLATGGPFTIFAPDDSAFNRLPPSALAALKNDTNALAEILKYHVVSGTYKIADLKVNEMMIETLTGDQLRINDYLYKHRITIEGASITFADKICSNGVIHRVSQVLMPPKGSIVDVLQDDGHFNTLIAAAQAAGLVDALSDGPITLMAPEDSAFARLGNDTVSKLLANPDILAEILKYHVIHGSLYSAGMHSEYLNTLELHDRERLYASFSGYTVMVDGARVVQKDMSATNGVVHKIDHVLIPSSLKAKIAAL